jgi:hypothetical protein
MKENFELHEDVVINISVTWLKTLGGRGGNIDYVC